MNIFGLSSPENWQPEPPGGIMPAGLLVGFDTFVVVEKSTNDPAPLDETKVRFTLPQTVGAVAQSGDAVMVGWANTLKTPQIKRIIKLSFFI